MPSKCGKQNVINLFKSHIRCFRNKCDIVEEPKSSSKHDIRVKFLSLITRNLVNDFFRPWYDCQSSIDIKFLNYTVFRKRLLCS